MKALIVNHPKDGKVLEDEMKFGRMANILQKGGLSAKYYPIYKEIQLIDTLSRESFDIVFSADYSITSRSNENINIHALFENLQLPYIGSSPDVLELVLSKSRLKQVWQQKGVSTPFYKVINKDNFDIDELEESIASSSYPFILKPDAEGNSRGLSESCVVNNISELNTQLGLMLPIYRTVLLEQFLGNAPDLQEFTIAMIGNGDYRLLMPARIQLMTPKKVRIITTQDKDEHKTQATPIIENRLHEKLITFVQQALDAANVRDYARCDVLFANDQFFAIEINGQPMIPDKWFEVCCHGVGLNHDQYLNAIFLAGITRNIQEGKTNLSIPDAMYDLLPERLFPQLA